MENKNSRPQCKTGRQKATGLAGGSPAQKNVRFTRENKRADWEAGIPGATWRAWAPEQIKKKN